MAVVLLTSCASGRVKTTPNVEPPTTAAPNDTVTSGAATSGAATSGAPASSTSSVPAADVRCPAPPHRIPTLDEATQNAFQRDQSLLLEDQRVVQTYLAAHADEAFDVQYSFEPPARLEVRVSDHADAHRGAIEKLVAHPDRLDVIKVGYSPADVRRVSAELIAETQTRRDTFSSFSGLVEADRTPFTLLVGLTPGNEPLADDLVKRWGPIIQIEVGDRPYVPAGCGEQPPSPRCPELEGIDPATIGLELSIVLTTPTITASQTGQAELVERNIGRQRFSLDSGQPITGVLVDPGTRHVVGRYSGAIAGVGGGPDLAPGESGKVKVVFGATRCDGKAGTALPPGTYGLRVGLTAEGPDAGTYPVYLSPEALVIVTA
jgi:hypothetical protein